MQAAIYSLAGPALTADERAFFADVDPAGYILFRRNCETRAQLKALTDDLHRALGAAVGVADLFAIGDEFAEVGEILAGSGR